MKKSFIAMVGLLLLLSGCGMGAANNQGGITITDLQGTLSNAEKSEAEAQDVPFECSRNGLMIRGAIRLPKDFNEQKQYPAAILSHGIFSDRNQGGLFTKLTTALEEQGIVTVRFDFDGYGQSEGSLKTNSIKTETEDLVAVVKAVQSIHYINPSQISLVGYSMGGAATSLAAGQLQDQINRVVLWAPAAVIVDDCEAGTVLGAAVDVSQLPEEIPVLGGQFSVGKAFFEDAINLDIYGISAKYTGPVLILQGNEDVVVPMIYAEKYHEVYTDSELVAIEKANHIFVGEALNEVIQQTVAFIAQSK